MAATGKVLQKSLWDCSGESAGECLRKYIDKQERNRGSKNMQALSEHWPAIATPLNPNGCPRPRGPARFKGPSSPIAAFE